MQLYRMVGMDGDVTVLLVSQIGKQQASLATNKHASLVLEKLLRVSSPKQLRNFFRGLAGYFNFLAFNRFSTHVLETLLSLLGPVIATEVETGHTVSSVSAEVAAEHAAAEAAAEAEAYGTDVADDGKHGPGGASAHASTVCELVHRLCDEMGESWMTLMSTPGSTHVVRALLAVITGRPVPVRPDAEMKPRNRKKKKKRKRPASFGGAHGTERDGSKGSTAVTVADVMYDVPDSFGDLLQSVVDEVCHASPEQLEAAISDVNAGPCLQHLLHVCVGHPSYRAIACALLQWPPEEGEPPVLLRLAKDKVGSHLVEAVLDTCGGELFQELATVCFRNRLWDLCNDATAHFVVAKLVAAAKDERIAVQLVHELTPSMQGLLEQVCVCVCVCSGSGCVRSCGSRVCVRACFVHRWRTVSCCRCCFAVRHCRRMCARRPYRWVAWPRSRCWC